MRVLKIYYGWGDKMAEEAINTSSVVQDEWGQICSQLKTEVGDTAFESWLKPLTPGSFNDGVMNICVPTRFMRNWVITHYSDRIHKIWEKKNPQIKSVNGGAWWAAVYGVAQSQTRLKRLSSSRGTGVLAWPLRI